MAGCGCTGKAMCASCKLKKLLVELVVVGLVFALLFAVLARVFRVPVSVQVLRLAFVAGALGHVLFEFAGVNQWYVRQYTPLLQ